MLLFVAQLESQSVGFHQYDPCSKLGATVYDN